MKSVETIIQENIKTIETMAEHGDTDKEISEKIGVSYATFKRYKTSYGPLKEVMATCKDKKNEAVEKALFNCCTGYEYEEETVVKIKKETIADNGAVLTNEIPVVKKVKKYCKPDLNAQKYWLNNKKKSVWADDPNKVANDKKLTKLKEKEVNSKVIE